MKKFSSLAGCLMVLCASLQATVYRVGDAWGAKKDYSTLQELISAGAAKATTDSIFIAGSHTLTAQWVVSTWQGAVFGGFAGTESSPSERALAEGGQPWEFQHPTVIGMAAGTTAQASLICSFKYTSDGEIPSLFDGITFDGTHCTATPVWFRQFSSGGVTIQNCVVKNSTLATDNTLNPGTADFIAGGIQLGSDDASKVSNVLIKNCLIQNCSARVGGIVARNTTIDGCFIMNNRGADSDKAGGIFAYGTTTVKNSVLWNNTRNGSTSNDGRSATGISFTATGNRLNALTSLFTADGGNTAIADSSDIFRTCSLTVSTPDGVTLSPALPATIAAGKSVSFTLEGVPQNKRAIVLAGSDTLLCDNLGTYTLNVTADAALSVVLADPVAYTPVLAATDGIDWASFLAPHDMYWTSITADPTSGHSHSGRKVGYYAGALMGNGLLGTNLYKLKTNVYRLNVGRSDVTEARSPYNLFNSARLPIGYFTISTVGNVTQERMRLSLYNAQTRGTLTTNKGKLKFKTYVHALENYIVFESEATGEEAGYAWDFVPQQAISPRAIYGGSGQPSAYLNHEGKSNPDAYTRTDGDYHLLIQPLAADSSFATINRYYVVAWKAVTDGNTRRIIATVSQENTLALATANAKSTLRRAFGETSSDLEKTHKDWWHNFYKEAAFVSLPNAKFESFYWAQYYKFASTTRSGKPIVDLQGVWPTYDTTWPAIWMNLNIQLTYSWLTKANLKQLEQPLWDAFWTNRDNLTRNVTDISSQSTWTDSRVMPRSSTYDMLSPLDPSTVKSNQYEVGNLTWTLFYYWQQCVAYGDTAQIKERLFPLLKSAVNIFFHIRTTSADGTYGLPSTASPEYISSEIGTNANYDIANLRWGLMTLIDIDTTYHMNDPMLTKWQDFLDHLVDYPYSATTGFKVSDKYEFTDTSHRHYSHLFMIYPYHMLDWEDPVDGPKMELSVGRWNGNQGYSRTGKAAMLASKGDGDGALSQMTTFFGSYLRPNTLYNETGPVIETPLAAVSSLHEFYMQDWGNKIRVFWGCPSEWKEASFINMRAKGAFLVSANRKNGKTTFIQIESEQGGICRLQTGMNPANIMVVDLAGNALPYTLAQKKNGVIEVSTSKGQVFQVYDKETEVELPHALDHDESEANPFGDGTHTTLPLQSVAFRESQVTLSPAAGRYTPELIVSPADYDLSELEWSCGNDGVLTNENGLFLVRAKGSTWVALSDESGQFTDTCYISVPEDPTCAYLLPQADSYTYKTMPSARYGQDKQVIVRRDDSGFARNGYYQFNLRGISNPSDNFHATLSLYVDKTGNKASTVNWQAYSTETALWLEDSICWNNQPGQGTLLDEVQGFNKTTDGAYTDTARIEFDVTQYVLQQMTARDTLASFLITQSARATSGAGNTYFASRQTEDGQRMPYLLVTGTDLIDAIRGITAGPQAEGPVRYYTIDGVNVLRPTSTGIYIRRQGNSGQKIIVR